MNIVLLSGGSGKRLWPLSNDVRSKQFIKIFKDENGGYESMVQRVYRQIMSVDAEAHVTIATSKSQVSAIHNQIGQDVGISVEPCRRDTFPAIALATAYLHDVQGLDEKDAVVVCPVDPYVDADYFRCVKRLYEAAQKGENHLVLMGIEPDSPSEKYGYIKPILNADGTLRYAFTEKPTEEKAREYIAAGALWNGGVFAYRLSYVLEKARELLGTADYRTLLENYASLKKISFDYAVVEQETDIAVLRYTGTWKDIGTWNTFTEAMEDTVVGRGLIGDGCDEVHIINELNLPILTMGLKNAVVAASPDGILVSSQDTADKIKPWVDAIDQQIMYAEKSWGRYQVLDVGEGSLTILVSLNPGTHMSYHSHVHRDEVWTVTGGSGTVTVDGEERRVESGSVIRLPTGCCHTAAAGENGLRMIEVQLGRDISAADKKKHELQR